MSHIMPSSIGSPPPPPRAPVMICIKLDEPLPPRLPPAETIFDACLWALDNPELQKACYVSRVCQHDKPKQCQYSDIVGIQQVGPTCGLTALSMLLNGEITSQNLLKEARNRRYTNNGEMFSAKYLYDLLCDQMEQNKIKLMPSHAILHEGLLDCNEIKECLQAGDCLLVPYPF